MEELIERYEKRLVYLNVTIANIQTDEDQVLTHKRLIAKRSVYRTVIRELKQLVRDHE